MHSLTLLEAAKTSVFSNSKLMAVLQDEIGARFGKNKEKGDFTKNVFNALKNDLDEKLGKSVKLDEFKLIFQHIWPKDFFSNGEIPLLNSLFNQNFVLENTDSLIIQPGRISAFAKLSSRVDPAVIAGWGLANIYCKKTLDLERILSTSICSHENMYLSAENRHQALAENHIHYGGAFGIDLSFFSAIFSDAPRGPVSENFSSLRRWLVEFIALSDPMNVDSAEKLLKKEFSGRWAGEVPILADWSGWSKNMEVSNKNILFTRIRQSIAVAWSTDETDRAWIGLYFWLWLCYKKTSSKWVRMSIMLAVITMMDERSKVLMQGAGLDRFVQGYHRASRKHGTSKSQNMASARRIFGNKNNSAEIKVAFNDIANTIPNFTEAISKILLENEGKLDGFDKPSLALERAVTMWHCCVHFFRLAIYLNNPSLILEEARAMGRLLSSRPNWKLTDAPAKFAWANLRIGDWIRGIDVAGNENVARIEYFSPAIRLLRDVLFEKDENGNPYAPVHLSLHAGEDFVDIASGLRHIDESVIFCNMRAGDRIGHGLALGISANEWAINRKSISIKLDEHIDNLVWSWRRCKELKISGFSDVMAILNERTMKLYRRLPWIGDYIGKDLNQWNMDDFSLEWNLRRNSYDRWNEICITNISNSSEDVALVPNKEILDDESNRARNLFMMRARWLRDNKADKEGSFQEMPTVYVSFLEPNDKLSCDVEFDDDLCGIISDSYHPRHIEFLATIQKLLTAEYSRKKLQIEVNLTSNVYVSDLAEYNRHPIFKWNSPRPADINTPLEVTINTDDPGVMPTSLHLEFAILKEAALSAGFGSDETLKWLSNLRKLGWKEFNSKHSGCFRFPKPIGQ